MVPFAVLPQQTRPSSDDVFNRDPQEYVTVFMKRGTWHGLIWMPIHAEHKRPVSS